MPLESKHAHSFPDELTQTLTKKIGSTLIPRIVAYHMPRRVNLADLQYGAFPEDGVAMIMAPYEHAQGGEACLFAFLPVPPQACLHPYQVPANLNGPAAVSCRDPTMT